MVFDLKSHRRRNMNEQIDNSSPLSLPQALELSKLPPAEPVALIRHKWPATSCGKPLRNASHRVF